jgi:hypothetical protein
MKKAFFLFALIAALTACNNNDGNSNSTDGDAGDGIGTGPRSTDEDTTATNVHNVENANGNMPDTTNSINIGTETEGKPADSTRR